MRIFLAIVIITVVSLAVFWQPSSQLSFWQESIDELNLSTQEAQSNQIKQVASSAAQTTNNDKLSAPNQTSDADFIPDPEAVASLRQARLEGDPRAPKLSKHHERELPTAEELGDHEQYVEYERRQQKPFTALTSKRAR
jgi:type II secretory pathway component PulM